MSVTPFAAELIETAKAIASPGTAVIRIPLQARGNKIN